MIIKTGNGTPNTMRNIFLFIVTVAFTLVLTLPSMACETRNLQISGNVSSASPEALPPENPSTFDELEQKAAASIVAQVYDSQNQSRSLLIYFFHANLGVWFFDAYVDGQQVIGGTEGTPVLLGGVRPSFPPDGSPSEPGNLYAILQIPWEGGAHATKIKIDFSQISAYNAPSSVESVTQDGSPNACPQYGKLDFDGDGRDDFAIWRPTLGMWAILKSSVANSDLIWKQWGLAGDYPMPGDYTGDGKADLVVWRPTDGTWYVCKSDVAFDCSKPLIQQFGLPGDRPIKADYDNDGILDFAVWRPLTGTFYYKPSNFGDDLVESPVTRQWGLPGDIPLGTAVNE